MTNGREPEPGDEFYERGLSAHRSNDPVRAELFYKSALDLSPQHAPALAMLGVLALQVGHAALAERLSRRAIWSGGETPDRLCNLAAILQSRGDRQKAKSLYRRVLAFSPTFGEAARNLAITGIEEGDRSLALDWHRRIAAAWPGISEEPGFKEAWRLLEAAEAQSRALGHPTEDRSHYLVIKPWACGFWGEVHHVVTQIVLAEISGRTPVVFWNADCRYWEPGDGNAWEIFFEPVAGVRFEDLATRPISWFPPDWTPERLHTEKVNYLHGEGPKKGRSSIFALISDAEAAVADGYMEFRQAQRLAPAGHPLARVSSAALHRRIFQSHIRLRPEVLADIRETAEGLFRKRPVIAVHYRAPASFKQVEAIDDHEVTPGRYFPVIDGFLASRRDAGVFLLTDFTPAIGTFRDRYGDRLLMLPATRLENAEAFEVGLDRGHDGHRLAREVLRDAYMAAMCDAFVGDGASGVSCSIMSLKSWHPTEATLLRANVFTERG